MVRLSILFLSFLTSTYALSLEKAKNLKLDLQSKNIISQIFKEFDLKPSLKILYEDKIIENGMTVSVEQSSQTPLVSFELGPPEKKYTLMMFDADTRLYHWVVRDIHGIENNETSSQTEIPFEPTIPSHRYVFALLEQPQNTKPMKLSRYFDWMQIAENNLELNSAIYINYHKKYTKRDIEISEPINGSLLGQLSGNLMGVLEQFGVHVATRNNNEDIIDHSRAFASSFNSIKSVNENDNSRFLPVPTPGFQFEDSNLNRNKNNPAEIVENVISRAFLEFQSQMSANHLPTPTLQLRKKGKPDPMIAVESMFNRAILNMERRTSIDKVYGAADGQQTMLTKKDPTKVMEKMIDNAFRDIQSQVSLDQLLSPTPATNSPDKSPVDIFEGMLNHIFKDIQDHGPASQSQPKPTPIRSGMDIIPSSESLSNSHKKSDPWSFGSLHNMIGTIADLRKMLSSRLKDNILEREVYEPEDSKP
ncbi:hypothetical protein BY458DRAFT_590179 [Sporodiniella umbellata]|nr:hypothetical protein BY458DRAFT_590179 [Sporodiniella umbellata]